VVEAGRAAAPIAAAWLCGSAAAFFKGVVAAARDLSFQPLDGMIGSPTLLVSGLELRGVLERQPQLGSSDVRSVTVEE